MKIFASRILLLFSVLTTTGVYAQPCSVNITSSDTLICSGDTIALTAFANGPDNQLQTTNAAGNNHRGNMFDIAAGTSDITILSFDASPMGNTTIEIYYKAGTWDGFANTPSAWTFVGSAPVLDTGSFSAVPINVNVTIPAGETYGFYVTSNTTAVSLDYSNGTAVGNVYASDANISFLEGGGMEYPFTAGTGAVYQPRIWNGMIHYALANQPGTILTWGGGETTSSLSAVPTATSTFTIEAANVPGCPAILNDTLDVVVSIPPVNAGTDRTVCQGEEVLLFGEGAASYSWDNGVTDSTAFVPAGTATYVVSGTDSIGCIAMDTVTVTVHPAAVVFAGNDFDVCAGSTVTLSGQGADTYSWNNGVTDNVSFEPTATATYALTGTDTNGCVAMDTIVVTVNENPIVSAGPDLDLCQGIAHTFTGAGAQTYNWSNGVTDGVPFIPVGGTYTVVGTDTNGCTGADEMTVTLHNVMASIFPAGTMLTAGVLVDMTAQWVNCSDMSAIPGATDAIFEPALTGSYAIVVEDNVYGCSDTSNCVLIDFTGIEEMLLAELSVYPVPTNGKVTVTSSGAAIERVELIDLLGKVLESVEPNAVQTEIDLSVYGSHTFFLRVYRSGHTALLKVAKN